MISAVSVGSIIAISVSCSDHREADLVAVGQWALAAGNSALVSAVTLAIEREGLRDA
jgi:hypothetical protein